MWLEEFEMVTDKRVRCDLIKYKIRQVTIKYSKERACERRKKLSGIETSLKTLEENCSGCPSSENEQILKMEYDSIYEELSRGAIIRSKANWYEKGEKSNKYFLNLESHNKAKSSVRKVFSKEGFLVVDPRKVLREIDNFYSNLFQKDDLDPSENLINSLLKNSQIPKLSVDEVKTCEGKL